MKLLNDVTEAIKKVHDYFGYVEDWVSIPMDDATEYYWSLHQDSDGCGDVHFNGEPYKYEDDPMYSNEIYTQRFLTKWVYRGAEYTMVVVDTHVDGNKFLQIFDNAKEIKGEV